MKEALLWRFGNKQWEEKPLFFAGLKLTAFK